VTTRRHGDRSFALQSESRWRDAQLDAALLRDVERG
jgi:hypothetical protein